MFKSVCHDADPKEMGTPARALQAVRRHRAASAAATALAAAAIAAPAAAAFSSGGGSAAPAPTTQTTTSTTETTTSTTGGAAMAQSARRPARRYARRHAIRHKRRPVRRTHAAGAGASPSAQSTAGTSAPASNAGGGTAGQPATQPGTTTQPAKPTPPPPPGAAARGKGAWVTGFMISEYWPVPESWFTGKLVQAPGLTGLHRIDWLYSASGVSMEGEGLGLDGQMYHIDAVGKDGWVTLEGKPTDPTRDWNGGTPYWRAGAYWRNAQKQVTFPLQGGGWSNGNGRKYVPLPGVSFAPGASLPLHPYASIAVDPKVIPLGSLVYIPAYQNDGHGGWFVAQDTGGAIKRHHIDVYRTPPSSPNIGGQLLTGENVYVIKPGQIAPS